jgi:hypothetical protein
MATHTISPAGDPFQAAPHGQDERPHACIGGVVYVGHLVEGDDGEETEVFEAVPCGRCSEAS